MYRRVLLIIMKTTSPARTVIVLTWSEGPLHLNINLWEVPCLTDSQVGVTVAVLSLAVHLALSYHPRPQLLASSWSSIRLYLIWTDVRYCDLPLVCLTHTWLLPQVSDENGWLDPLKQSRAEPKYEGLSHWVRPGRIILSEQNQMRYINTRSMNLC